MSELATLHLLNIGSIDGDRVTGTVSLVIDGDARLVVDPGMVADRDQLLSRLASHGVTSDRVTHVLLTHHHPDHTLNVGLFPNADVVDIWATYHGDLWLDHSGDGYRPSPHVRLMATPGHTNEDATWLIETDGGLIACTHAWWQSDRTPEEDPYAPDQAVLEESRRHILSEATVVVPGHGSPFRVDGGTDAA